MDLQVQARKLIERSEEIESALQRPDLLDDMQKLASLNKQLKDNSQGVTKAKAYLEAIRDRGQWAKAADEPGDSEMQQLAYDEVKRLDEAIPALEHELKLALIPKEKTDERGAILEIRAGTGGDEASLFAGDLFRMYKYYCEGRRWRFVILDENEGTAGGYKEVVAEVTGDGVYGILKYESGVHRVQRVPDTETQGRVHTSAATVVILPIADEFDDIVIRPEDLRVDTYRSGGSGGQHINKTDSAVRLTHLPTGIVVACQDERSQHKNRDKAMNLLKSKLLDKRLSEKEAKEAADRKSQVGTGDRSAKIRTYNFPQGRITDHRVGLTLYKLDAVMHGAIDELIDALAIEANSEKLRDLERQDWA